MDNLNRQFGLIVAYLLPGFIALAGVAPLIPVVSSWLQPLSQGIGFGTDLGVFILCAVLFAGSRDALSKYRTRSGQLVGHVAEKE